MNTKTEEAELVQVHRFSSSCTLLAEWVDIKHRHLCDWCKARPGELKYWVRPDMIKNRDYPTEGEFCSRECWKNYHTGLFDTLSAEADRAKSKNKEPDLDLFSIEEQIMAEIRESFDKVGERGTRNILLNIVTRNCPTMPEHVLSIVREYLIFAYEEPKWAAMDGDRTPINLLIASIYDYLTEIAHDYLDELWTEGG